jgi:lipopolysaccharide transport system permease protein
VISRLRAFLDYRELLKCLVARDVSLRYKGSFMGFLWALLNPLMMMIIFTFVFTRILKMGIRNYPLFLFSAFIPWNFLQVTLATAAISITQYAPIISKIFFPREILPVSLVISNFIHTFLVGLVINFILIAFNHVPISCWILFLPLIIAVQIILVTGLSLLLSCLQVYFRDISVILNHVLIVWFYCTPIFYPLEMVPEPYLTWIRYNPMTGIIEAYRKVILYASPPDFIGFLYSSAISVLILVLGYWVFNRYQDFFAEEI